MPIYEYRCAHCGQMLTVRQSMHAPALTHCPQCGQESLKKLISASFVSSGTQQPCKTMGACPCHCASCPQQG
ncbi:MAG: zinc ribbon domain-containing protein [Candidatus Anaerobiospirillum merdipullorum]|uniref:Zinc ribbon domain-containing protein n=1 Tax=Candidatus Anaerobiospirillum merdipullorum TaxID=2838450 RepID=A0A9E2KP49_9GAMM|nr:zinc ribbon domain-containing protein [Candidatus Anaerobiospirillum merdipullorum]